MASDAMTGGRLTDATPAIRLDYPAMLAREFPLSFGPAWAAVQDVLSTLPGTDFSALEPHSPSLRGFDWANYLCCSASRMVHVLNELHQAAGIARVLDVGAYFGNFALMCRHAGYSVDAVDAWGAYGQSLARCVALMRTRGVTVHDFTDVGFGLDGLALEAFDAVICAGVIEHVPHTPRPLLEAVTRCLRPGGLLVIDTPNLAYVYNRQRLARGESIMPPIHAQFVTAIPYEGHHREYTADEVRWMVEYVGLEHVGTRMLNYSIYGASELTGIDAENFLLMERDPSMREIILCVSRKAGSR